jgi:hypothetical protein
MMMANGRLATSIFPVFAATVARRIDALRVTQTDRYTRFKSVATHARWAAFTGLLVMLTSCAWCQSGDVVLVRATGTSSAEQQELELSAQFYGVNLKVVSAGDSNSGAVLRALRQNTTLGVAIQADALASIRRDELLAALRDGVPVLILGVTPETQPTLLSTWSGGAAVGVQRLESTTRPHYVVDRVVGITQQLTDLEIPFPGNDTFYFALAGHSKAQEIMAVRNDRQVVPVFIQADLRQQKIFLLCKTHPAGDSGVEAGTESIETAFTEIAPMMMFVKYAAGERGWHALHHYANLTIDDPWLREPYGDLSYKGLFKEMEKHDFHTTIAFIPWNYDRNEAETISLFRNHPERFSICIHGDNHDHKEFEDLESKPLNVQLGALKQSLARMEKFQTLTGIPYDNVFVFPHSIGTENILKELKAYNVLATINSSNVPMDRVRPTAPLFTLRPVTLSFADFPSISRYSAAVPIPNSFLAINEFLDNPLFFYTHQEFFRSGIDAFDGMADNVNKLEPDTEWRSVGDIVKHSYLVRLRDDSNYDALAFSNSFDLDNTSQRSLVFDVDKQESGSPVIASVSVDGRDYPFQLRQGHLNLSVTVPAGGVRRVIIRYKNDLDLASISTSKSSLRVYLLRKVSDYRDITLSKYYLGRVFTDYYYKDYGDRDRAMPVLVIVFAGIFVLFAVGGSWGLWFIMKRRNSTGVDPDVLRKDKIARATGVGSTGS